MTDSKPDTGTNAILFRPTPSGFQWIEDLRRKHDVHRTDVVRQALAIASQHQPELEQRLASLKDF